MFHHSILAQHADDAPLDFHVTGGKDDRVHLSIGGLQAHAAVRFTEESLERGVGAVGQSHHHFAVGTGLSAFHQHVAAVSHAAVPAGTAGAPGAAGATRVPACLSKGLGARVGSLLAGSADFVARARTERKRLGGGMRQVGVLAAPGLVALRDGPAGMIERLAEDHANARRLAEALAEMAGVESPGDVAQPEPGPLDPNRVRASFVLFRVARDRGAFLETLERRGVAMIAFPHGQIRAVTHYGIEAPDIEATIAAVRGALAETVARPVAVA